MLLGLWDVVKECTLQEKGNMIVTHPRSLWLILTLFPFSASGRMEPTPLHYARVYSRARQIQVSAHPPYQHHTDVTGQPVRSA